MKTSEIRKAFEAWFARSMREDLREDSLERSDYWKRGGYKRLPVQYQWEAFKAGASDTPGAQHDE